MTPDLRKIVSDALGPGGVIVPGDILIARAVAVAVLDAAKRRCIDGRDKAAIIQLRRDLCGDKQEERT